MCIYIYICVCACTYLYSLYIIYTIFTLGYTQPIAIPTVHQRAAQSTIARTHGAAAQRMVAVRQQRRQLVEVGILLPGKCEKRAGFCSKVRVFPGKF